MKKEATSERNSLAMLRGILAVNVAEIRAVDPLRGKARLEYGVMLGSIVLVWLAGVYAHSYTPYFPDILPLHVIAAYLFAENLALTALSRTSLFSPTLYFGTFIVEQTLIFCLVYVTGGSDSPLFIIPILYFLGTFFIHGLIQGLLVFTLTLLGYVLPAVLGFQELTIVLQATLFLMILLPVIFVPIGLMITAERQKTLEALLESENRYRDLADMLPQTVFELDTSGNLTYANKSGLQMFGLSGEDVRRGVNVNQVIAPPDRVRLAENMRKTLRDLQPTSNEYTALRKDGSAFPILAFSNAVIRGYQPVGFRGIVIDITDRKLTEEKIRRMNEDLELKVRERTRQLMDAQEELVRKEKFAVLGQLAGIVGHELRNPLGVMNNAVYYLKTILADADETVKEYLDILKEEIAGSERIVADLLDSMRAKTPHPKAVEPGDLIRASLAKVRVPENISVVVSVADAAPPVNIDPLQMTQVFINLIKNGVDAMPRGGTLEIDVSRDEGNGAVRFRVRDTGTGIAPEHREKLFQPLFTTKSRGIGLGLVVVKNLTEANSGSIDVESEPGRGTTFTISMPAAGAPQ